MSKNAVALPATLARHTSASTDASLHVPQALTPRIQPVQGASCSSRKTPAADGSRGLPVRRVFLSLMDNVLLMMFGGCRPDSGLGSRMNLGLFPR